MSKQNYIHLGDARLWLPNLKPESVDMVLTDPPYGMDFNSNMIGRGKSRAEIEALSKPKVKNDGEDEAHRLRKEIFPMMLRVLRDGGVAAVFSSWREIDHTISELETAGFTYEQLLIWDKAAFGMGWCYRYSYELIVLASRGGRDDWRGGKDKSDILRYNMRKLEPFQEGHPTPKPMDLMIRLVLDNSKPGEVVLDPMCGTGPAMAAAVRCGRVAWGCEEMKRWHKAAEEWVVAEEKQGKLFEDADIVPVEPPLELFPEKK